ncbi:MAG: GSU2403 family nucleotidyltransferase fold protein [Candidatus Omnitrophota bacterium]
MEKSQYNLCLEVLRRLHKAGIFKNAILVGSWCMPFYKEYFAGQKYDPSIRTRDIDFLIPRPSGLDVKIDVADLVKDLGFVRGFRGHEGYIVLEHPDLIIEFLVPEKGRGTDKPVKLPALGLNAQSLRFMELLSEKTIKIRLGDIVCVLPHPANFAFHKILISNRRPNSEKTAKDREASVKILMALIEKGEQRLLRDVYNSIPSKWKQSILKQLRAINEVEILNIIHVGPLSKGTR